MRGVLPAGSAVTLVTGPAGFVKKLLYAALVIALVALAVVLAAAAAPRFLGYGMLVVTGGSMGDSIPNGSLVAAHWLDRDDVEVGDVILARGETAGSYARPKLHRVVSLQRDAGQVVVRTKGDANKAEDPLLYVLPDRVLTPAYDVPYLGFLVAVVSSPLGWLLVVAVPGTILCLLALRSIWFPGPETLPAAALQA